MNDVFWPSSIQSMMAWITATRVSGWHLGGSYWSRSRELWNAPGAIWLRQRSLPPGYAILRYQNVWSAYCIPWITINSPPWIERFLDWLNIDVVDAPTLLVVEQKGEMFVCFASHRIDTAHGGAVPPCRTENRIIVSMLRTESRRGCVKPEIKIIGLG